MSQISRKKTGGEQAHEKKVLAGSARDAVLETRALVVARDAVETVVAPETAVHHKASGWKHTALLKRHKTR